MCGSTPLGLKVTIVYLCIKRVDREIDLVTEPQSWTNDHDEWSNDHGKLVNFNPQNWTSAVH